MNLAKFLALFCLISSRESRKLSAEENEKRLEQCGNNQKSKVYNGRESSLVEAPWSIQVHSPGSSCTGTVISPRHVLTATHCVADVKNEKEWQTTKLNYKFDRKKCKKHNNVIITETLASKLTVHRNGTLLGRAKFLIMIGFCRIANEGYFYEYADDIMIVELSEDMEYSRELQPACVARDVTDNKADAVLDFFGYGEKPEKNEKANPGSAGVLRHHQIKVNDENKKGTKKRMDKRIFLAQSATKMSIACPGDSGAGAMRKIDGRTTIVGVMSRSSCAQMKREKDAFEVHISVGYFADTICKYSGVCTPEPHSGNTRISALFAFLVTFWMIL